MSYVPVPLNQLQLGSPLQVDLRTPDGRLLLGRGQVLNARTHREMLVAHQACISEVDAKAWQKALDRSLRQMIAGGVAPEDFGHIAIPVQILDIDYFESQTIEGGWLDLQEILRGLQYQGSQAVAPVPRLLGLEQKAMTLLSQDADECLFVLFQALPDLAMGYCATRSLLCGAVAALTAHKLSLSQDRRSLLMQTSLVMDIGMARQQDSLASQLAAPSDMQRNIITNHASMSVDILCGFGVQDAQLLGMIRWHHDPKGANGQVSEPMDLELLSLADSLVAKMAPRISRSAMSSLGAAKALVLDTNAENQNLRSAMASVLGFYPPGTYVELANGEMAVVISRGQRATTPHVACLIKTDGMPLGTYLYRDTRQEGFAVRTPVSASRVNIKVSLEKVRRLRYQRGV